MQQRSVYLNDKSLKVGNPW